jgi:hypothetical protein
MLFLVLPTPVEIPFEYNFGTLVCLLLVKADVNGKPPVLVLDTGSNQTIISSTVVALKQGSLTDWASTALGWRHGYLRDGFLRLGFVNWRDHRILEMER